MRKVIAVIVIMGISGLGVSAYADLIAFREGGDEGGVSPISTHGGTAVADVRNVVFEDTVLIGGVAGQNETNYGLNTTMQMRSSNDEAWLVMIRDLFTELPAVDGLGGALVIDSAEFSGIKGDTSTSAPTLTIYRVISDWDVGVDSELNVSRNKIDIANGTWWNAGDTPFDEDLNLSAVGTDDVLWAGGSPDVVGGNDRGYGGRFTWDATAIVQDIYATGNNYGFGWQETSGTATCTLRASEYATISNRPQLIVEYHYEPIPEPGTVLLVGSGLLGMIGYIRRRKMA